MSDKSLQYVMLVIMAVVVLNWVEQWLYPKQH
jgi:hypothetical protein